MHRARPIMAIAALLLILLYLVAPGPIGAAEQPDTTEAFRMPGEPGTAGLEKLWLLGRREGRPES